MEKSMSDAMRIWLYNGFSSDEATKSKVIHAVWCNITCEAAGQIWTWSPVLVCAYAFPISEFSEVGW